MEMISVLGIGLIGAVLIILIKQYRPEYTILLSAVTAGALFLIALVWLVPLFGSLGRIAEEIYGISEPMKVVLKCLGVCYLTELGSALCKESGQTAISSKIELCGRILILTLSLPLVETFLGLIKELIRG